MPATPGDEVSVELTPLAESASGRSIGITARLGLPEGAGGPHGNRSSRLTVLPAPTETDVAAAIERLLGAGSSADGEAPEERPTTVREETVDDAVPDWVDELRLPAEKTVREEMRAVEEEMERLESRLEGYRAQLRTAGHLKGLLFKTGDPLVEVTLEALERLGARIEEAGEEVGGEARIADPEGRHAMVSVQSGSGAIGVDAVRDLDRMVRDAIALEGWEGRGLVIANARAPIPPHERGQVFTDDAVSVARRFDVALLRTDQLFVAVRQAQEGTFDRDRFWLALTAGEGPVKLPGLESAGD